MRTWWREYHDHAADCLRLAQTTEDLTSKALLLEMVQAWITLAEQRMTREADEQTPQ